MSNVITRADGLELAICEVCDNYTPVHYLDDDIVCKYCFDAYPDLF